MKGKSQMLGQASIMEYVLMSFFILVVIVIIIFFLTGFYVMQQRSELSDTQNQRMLSLLKGSLNLDLFNKGSALFDDGKLMGFMSIGESACTELAAQTGPDWFFRVSLLDGQDEMPCTERNYPDCNSWSICKDENRKYMSRTIPVTVYRRMSMKNDFGMVEVGIYTE